MSKSVRATSGFHRSFRRQATCQCASLLSARTLLPQSTRTLITYDVIRDKSRAAREKERVDEEKERDKERYGNRGRELRVDRRWESTPPRMMAPVRSKPLAVNNDFVVNKDPKLLDEVYDRVLGKGGCAMLTEEVKWLSVTHKSFDHGRRGFNDRLGFLGIKVQQRPCSLG